MKKIKFMGILVGFLCIFLVNSPLHAQESQNITCKTLDNSTSEFSFLINKQPCSEVEASGRFMLELKPSNPVPNAYFRVSYFYPYSGSNVLWTAKQNSNTYRNLVPYSSNQPEIITATYVDQSGNPLSEVKTFSINGKSGTIPPEPPEPPITGNTGSFGVYYWNSEDISAHPEYQDFMLKNGINEIYLTADLTNVAQTSEFITRANQHSISVYYLIGEYQRINDFPAFQQVIAKYQAYQNQVSSNAKFAGLHLDVEPHQHPNFSSERAKILDDYLAFMIKTRETYPSEKIDFDIPFWLDDTVQYNGQNIPLYQAIISESSRVFVMAYRDTAEAMYDVAKEEVAFANQIKKQIFLSAETYSEEGNEVSFAEEGAEYMDGELKKLRQKIGSGNGIAIHRIKPRYDMQPDYEVVALGTIGPGGGGRQLFPNVNPQDSSNVFVSLDMGGSFVSRDKGNTFKMKNLFGIGKFFFNPHNENIVYGINTSNTSVSRGLRISQNKGESWELLRPKASELAGLQNSEGGESPSLVFNKGTFLPSSELINIYVDPDDANIIYATTAGNLAGTVHPMIYKSTNAGQDWILFATLSELGSSVKNGNAFTYVEKLGGELKIFSNAGLARVGMDGKVLETINLIKEGSSTDYAGYSTKNDASYGAYTIKGDKMVVFANLTVENDEKYANKIFKSEDFGKTRISIIGDSFDNQKDASDKTLSTSGKRSFRAFDIYDENIIYVSFNGRGEGISKSIDGGKTWKRVFNPYNLANFKPGIVDYTFKNASRRTGTPYGLKVNKSDPNHVITTNMMDATQTTDGGNTWRSIDAIQMSSDGKFKTSGIEVAGPESFAIDPFDENHLYMGYTDTFAFQSWDKGDTREIWNGGKFSLEGIPNNASAVAFDPNNQGVMLSAWTSKQGSHNTSEGTIAGQYGYMTMSLLDYDQSVSMNYFRSTDGGKTRIKNTSDPSAQNCDNTKITDISKKWHRGLRNDETVSTPCNRGLPRTGVPTDIIFDPNHNNVVYTSIEGGGIYKSSDGGINWTRYNNGLTPVAIGPESGKIWDYWTPGCPENKPDCGKFSGKINGYPVRDLVLSKDKKTLFAIYAWAPYKVTNPYISNRGGGLFKLDLTNENATWQKVNMPNGNLGSALYQFDMDENGVMYAVPRIQLKSWNKVSFPGSDGKAEMSDVGLGGAYVSTDGGVSWKQIYNEVFGARGISVSPDGRLVYMTILNKIMVSFDGAETRENSWIEASGFEFKTPNNIYLDPNDDKIFYVATICGGMWKFEVKEKKITK